MISFAVPVPWRSLVQEINGGRIPDGEPGIRDVDAPCEAFKPYGKPWEHAKEFGACETDGHYLCIECVEIDVRVYRRRRDLCEDCGAKLVRLADRSEGCPDLCDVPVWRLREERAARAADAPGSALS